MKKITAKIKREIVDDELAMRRVINTVSGFCVPGTMNLTRIGLHQISFKISKANEKKLKSVPELIDIVSVEV